MRRKPGFEGSGLFFPHYRTRSIEFALLHPTIPKRIDCDLYELAIASDAGGNCA